MLDGGSDMSDDYTDHHNNSGVEIYCGLTVVNSD